MFVPRSKEVLKQKQTAAATTPYVGGDVTKEERSQLKDLPTTEDRTTQALKYSSIGL